MTAEQIDTIFPVNIVVSDTLVIKSSGPVMKRACPKAQPGMDFLECFSISQNGHATSVEAASGTSDLVLIDLKGAGSSFSGWVIRCGSDFVLALRISPSSYLLDDSTLQISDFAPGDPFVAGLLMFTMQRSLIEEQRAAAMDLARSRQKTIDLLARFSRISGYMAHDFNNFLSIIRLNCDRLMLDYARDSKIKRSVDIIKSATIRANAITSSLMTLSHQKEDYKYPTSVDEFITENKSFLSTIAGTQVSFELLMNSGNAKVLVSPVAALNCLMNVVINARDAMPKGGRITISTSVTPAMQAGQSDYASAFIDIKIIDSGVGMTDAILAQAFDPLFSTKPQGNGLGLASVREFAEESGGVASIDSIPGVGTELTIRLPAVREEAAPETNPHAEEWQTGENHLARQRVLVVDDEPYALEALCELLEAADFDVQGRANFSEAIATLSKAKFDFLLSDILLGNESGADLARSASLIDPGLHVILMSGYVPNEEEFDGRWKFVRKPLNTKIIIDLMRSEECSS